MGKFLVVLEVFYEFKNNFWIFVIFLCSLFLTNSRLYSLMLKRITDKRMLEN